MATTNTVNQNSIPDESIQEIISETENQEQIEAVSEIIDELQPEQTLANAVNIPRNIPDRQRAIREVLHDKVVRLFAEQNITPQQILSNQKTIRDGFIRTSRNEDDLLVLYQRDSDLYSEDAVETQKLNDIANHLESTNPTLPLEDIGILLSGFSMVVDQEPNATVYRLITGLEGTFSEVTVARETPDGITNQLNIGQLIHTTGDYEYDPIKANQVLDVEIDELLPAASNRQQLINDFFRLYAELRPPEYPPFQDIDGDGLTDYINEASASVFASDFNISNATDDTNKFITWYKEQEDNDNVNKSLEWLFEDLRGFFQQSNIFEESLDDSRPDYVDKSTGYLKLRSLNQGIIIRKQEGTDIGLLGPDEDNPLWLDTGFCITMWVKFLNKTQTGTLFNFGNPQVPYLRGPAGFALETVILKDTDQIDIPSSITKIGFTTAGSQPISGTYTVTDFCNIIESVYGYNPLQDQNAIRFLRLSVIEHDSANKKYIDNSIPKYGLPKYNPITHGLDIPDLPSPDNPNTAWALFTYPQVPINFNEWFFINASYNTNVNTGFNDNIYTAAQQGNIPDGAIQAAGDINKFMEYAFNNHVVPSNIGSDNPFIAYSGFGNNCIVEFISKSDLLRARGFKVG